jgi:hypothetical protein
MKTGLAPSDQRNTSPITKKDGVIIPDKQLFRPEPLFDHLFGGLKGWMATCHPHPNPEVRGWPHEFFLYPEEAHEAAEEVIAVAQEAINAYFCVHLLQRRGNRRADNALGTVRTLWFDEDEGRYPEQGPAATAVIYSSAKRRHLYWRLTRAVDAHWAADLNYRIAKWAKGDSGKAKLASVLRPAGTANYKREKPDLVGGYFTGVPEWDPEVIDQAIPPLPKAQRVAGFSRPYDGPPIRLHEYLENAGVLRELRQSSGVAFEILCPWISEHTTDPRGGTRVGQYYSTGACWFHCDHSHCEGRGWREFARKVGRTRRVNANLSGYTGDDLGAAVHYDR